jgi:hypothetical protein
MMIQVVGYTKNDIIVRMGQFNFNYDIATITEFERLCSFLVTHTAVDRIEIRKETIQNESSS